VGTAWNSAAISGTSPGPLARWDPRIRRFLFESELLSSLYFASDATLPNGWATLWSLTEAGTATGTAAPTGAWSKFVSMKPPSPAILDGRSGLPDQLTLVNGYADLRTDRAREIVAQMTPQYAFWGSVVPLYPARHQRTLELLGVVLRLAKYAEMNFKNAMSVRRPNEYSPQIQPMIQTPIHGSLPSGHSTEAHAVARVLYELMQGGRPLTPASQQLREQLMRQAARIAINRTVAGLHYPIDSMAGQLLGLSIGQYLIARARPAGAPPAALTVNAWEFDGTSYPAALDFSGAEIYAVGTDLIQTTAYLAPATSLVPPAPAVPAPTFQVRRAPGLAWLWDAAATEWP